MSITEKLGKMGIPGFRSGKWWKMLLAIPVYLFIGTLLLAFIVGMSSPPPATTPAAGYTTVPTTALTPAPTTVRTAAKTLEDIKNESIQVSYDDLMRNNEDYVGKIVFFQGRIIQVSETLKDKYVLRIGTKSYDNVIWVEYTGKRLLEDDVVNIWGEVKGLKSYTAVRGNEITIPRIVSMNLELVQKAGEQ